jgi:hypothetical protein
MRGSFGRVVRPIGAIDTSVVVIGLWILGHVLSGVLGIVWLLIGSVVFVDMYFKGDTADEI